MDELLAKHDITGVKILFEMFPEFLDIIEEEESDVEFTPTEIIWECLKQRLIDEGLWDEEADIQD